MIAMIDISYIRREMPLGGYILAFGGLSLIVISVSFQFLITSRAKCGQQVTVTPLSFSTYPLIFRTTCLPN